MNRRSRPWLVALLSLASVGSLAQAVDPIEVPVTRWRALDAEEQQEVLRRHEQWKRLTMVERQRLVARHEALRVARERVIDSLDPRQRVALRAMGTDARRRSVRDRLCDSLRSRGAEIRESMRRAGVDRPDGPTLVVLQRAARSRVASRIRRMVEGGVLDAGEAERLLELPTPTLIDQAWEIRRRWLLDDPRRLATLNASDIARIRDLPARRFAAEVRRSRGGTTSPLRAAIRRMLTPPVDRRR